MSILGTLLLLIFAIDRHYSKISTIDDYRLRKGLTILWACFVFLMTWVLPCSGAGICFNFSFITLIITTVIQYFLMKFSFTLITNYANGSGLIMFIVIFLSYFIMIIVYSLCLTFFEISFNGFEGLIKD